MASRTGLEPYSGKDLMAFIESLGGELLPTGSGTSHRQYRLDGRIVPATDRTVVPTVLARKVAVSLGWTYQELRARMGNPVKNGSRPRTRSAGHEGRCAVNAR